MLSKIKYFLIGEDLEAIICAKCGGKISSADTIYIFYLSIDTIIPEGTIKIEVTNKIAFVSCKKCKERKEKPYGYWGSDKKVHLISY